MDISRHFSLRKRQRSRDAQTTEDESASSYLPLLESPINEDAQEMLSSRASDIEKMTTNTGEAGVSVTTMLAGNGRTSSGNIVIYKPHHEASSIELFYDLFFVANLAYFTAMHQHIDTQSLINYLKLFTLLWFTWLSTTLFDVRFGIDCVWNRLHKVIQFGVFTGFVFAGPVFDKYNNSYDKESYRHFAIVLIVSRACIAVQYAVVMWQGRSFRQTLLPLGLSTAIHVAAAVAYAITLVVPHGKEISEGQQIVWVVIAIVEGLAVLLTAMIWRIVSFKYTHIVERLQLLTLIIIGEGIIGMVKSVACVTKGQAKNNSTELGSVMAAVVLLYLIYMLYFDQFSEDRFGTLRQQVWSLLHYPLHMAIVVCVEGNTSLIVWNSAVQALKFIWSLKCEDYSDPADNFDNVADYIAHLDLAMIDINNRFRSKKWAETYDWSLNVTAINNYTELYRFKSEVWNNKTGELVRAIFTRAQVFVFEAHADTLAKLNAVTPINRAVTTDAQQAIETRLNAIYDVFNVTVMSFYIGAGVMLLLLAILYWFNKMHKTKYEFGEIINRVVVGFILIVVGVACIIGDESTQGFKFKVSQWIIAIVVFSFVTVLVLDNILLALSRKTSRRNARRDASWRTSNVYNLDASTQDLLPHHPYSRTASRSPSCSAPLSRVSSTTKIPLSQIQTRISYHSHVTPTSRHHRSRSGTSQTRHNAIDFVQYPLPQSCSSSTEMDQIGLAMSPPLPKRNPSRGQDRNGKRKAKEAPDDEQADWSDAQRSDREDLRILGRARTS
ncbi:hypothetical protein OPT61_g1694 [Boeremia exigua]|uniref:Uncharacterized protein n=1 Tax=Boeremia exigua TaxID=749465 RepID=A0ACC2IPF0_9PLEO|nr:hypothetical protein OPT61_g1694 [Boeremia exigua]